MTRDFTPRQFTAELKRHGFEYSGLFVRRIGDDRIGIGAVLRPDGKGIDRRATLSRAIKSFEELTQ